MQGEKLLLTGMGHLYIRVFKGDKWHFVTVANRNDSEVTRRLKSKPAKLPFF